MVPVIISKILNEAKATTIKITLSTIPNFLLSKSIILFSDSKTKGASCCASCFFSWLILTNIDIPNTTDTTIIIVTYTIV